MILKNHTVQTFVISPVIVSGDEDEQFEEEKELIIGEIKKVSQQPILDS